MIGYHVVKSWSHTQKTVALSSGEAELTAMVKVNPGDKSVFKVDGTDVTVRVPEEDGPSSGIVWADPCVSDRWKPCALVDVAMERSKEMLNALSKDDTWTYFGECLGARKGAGQGQAAIDIFY